MSKRYSGKSFKDSSVMKKPKLTFKEKRKLKEEKKKKRWKNYFFTFFLNEFWSNNSNNLLDWSVDIGTA